jgi:hypothetical protein
MAAKSGPVMADTSQYDPVSASNSDRRPALKELFQLTISHFSENRNFLASS